LCTKKTKTKGPQAQAVERQKQRPGTEEAELENKACELHRCSKNKCPGA
jgi:hypothetical protein